MKTAIVLTTIHVPHLLEGYTKNFEEYNHKDVGFIVIGDLNTPREAGKVISRIRKTGFEAEYFGIPKQEKWLQHFPILKQMIPYNSDNRRNIGSIDLS